MTRARVLLPITLLALSLPLPAVAQDAAPARDWRGAARIAKWVLAGATLALGAYAYSEHHTAERLHGRLRDRCDASPEACNVVDGRYSDAESEALHQRAVRHDRQARTGIVAGQITLLGGVALFLYDLRGDRGPDNIPYPAPRRPARRASAGHDRLLILGARVPL